MPPAAAARALLQGPNLAGLDPFDDTLTPLFHPRRQRMELRAYIQAVRGGEGE